MTLAPAAAASAIAATAAAPVPTMQKSALKVFVIKMPVPLASPPHGPAAAI
jgi:hypothetical protein